MSESKLIKSFIVIKEFSNFETGDIISLKKYQAEIPLQHDELFYDCPKSNQTYKFKNLISELNNSLEVHEYFGSLKEKFQHIS